MEHLRILLADDHTLFRKGVESLLASRQHFEIVGSASNGREAIALAKKTLPDIILMDIDMPECNGLEATREIKRELPDVKIVMLTVSDDDENLFQAIMDGAQGYLLKDLEVGQLFDMLEGISRGEAPLSGVVAARILTEFTRHESKGPPEPDPGPVQDTTDKLSAREIEVLQLVVDGKSNREIANSLVITENTVKNHLSSILQKLHLNNRIQAAVYAVRQEVVRVDSNSS